MPRKPKKCTKCHKAIEIVTTDGAGIYYGEIKIPLEPMRFDFRCPFCQAIVRWERLEKGGKIGI